MVSVRDAKRAAATWVEEHEFPRRCWIQRRCVHAADGADPACHASCHATRGLDRTSARVHASGSSAIQRRCRPADCRCRIT